MESPRMRTYTAEGTTPFPSFPSHNSHNRRESVKSLDENEKFTAHCNNALAKIRLSYIRLL